MNILDKILELRNKFKDHSDQKRIESWESKAKKDLLILSLKDHSGFKFIFDNLARDIHNMNEQLNKLDSVKLPDCDRDRMIDKRDLYKKFLDIFIDAEKELRNVEKQVEENIE